MRRIVLFILIICPLWSLAQKIKGKIVDQESHQPIAYVTVQTSDHQKTISNENGEFEFNVSHLPVELKFSHISYQPAQAKITDSATLKIELKSLSLTLNEVVVGNYALTVMKNAFEKAKSNHQDAHYAKGFLRQVAYESDKPTYVNEIYFNADWHNYGLIKWHPTQARYLKGHGFISYSNISFFSLALSGYLFNDIATKPLASKLDSLYQFRMKGTYKQGESEIAIITCTPKVKISKMNFEGDYYVDTETYNVLRIEGVVNNFRMNVTGPVGIKNKGVNLIAQYRIGDDGTNVLEYSTLSIQNKMTIMGIGAKGMEFLSTLYMIDYNEVYDKDLVDVQPKTNDVEMTTKNMTFDAAFWKENQTIKRTLKEEEAIKNLEEALLVKIKNANH